jgi:hypothetical protein
MPFLKLFDICPGWVWAILFGLALMGGCAERNMHQGTKVKLAEAKAELAEVRAAGEKAARDLSEANRKIESTRFRVAEEVRDATHKENRGTAAAVDAGRSDRKRLLDATAAATAPSSSTATVSPQALARAEQKAAAFGKLLEQCDAVAENLGRDAEELATQVRGLQRSYNSLLATGPAAYSGQVDPNLAPDRLVVVDSVLPEALLDPVLDPAADLGGEVQLVRLEGHPPLHHALEDEHSELAVAHVFGLLAEDFGQSR